MILNCYDFDFYQFNIALKELFYFCNMQKTKLLNLVIYNYSEQYSYMMYSMRIRYVHEKYLIISVFSCF